MARPTGHATGRSTGHSTGRTPDRTPDYGRPRTEKTPEEKVRPQRRSLTIGDKQWAKLGKAAVARGLTRSELLRRLVETV